MSALVVAPDGKLSNVALKFKTLDEAFDEYQVLFPAARDVEMQDIYVRLGNVAGTRECICVFYDSGGFSQGKPLVAQVYDEFFQRLHDLVPVW